MNFNEYLDNAWSIHATNPKIVAEEFKNNFSLMESEEDVMSMTHLIVHVCGEHLGEWERGIELLKKLKNNATIKDKSAMNRYVAVLNLGNNPNTSIENFSVSDQIRIYSSVASALANLGGLKNAEKFLNKSVELITSLDNADPAHRSLAIAGNSVASTLEEKAERSLKEVEVMLMAAALGRKHWEITGTWKEVERAEYRLSQSFLKAQNLKQSLVHAEACMEIVMANGEDPLEAFFGYEALALAHKGLKNQMGFDSALNGMKVSYDRLDESTQSWCKESLDKLS